MSELSFRFPKSRNRIISGPTSISESTIGVFALSEVSFSEARTPVCHRFRFDANVRVVSTFECRCSNCWCPRCIILFFMSILAQLLSLRESADPFYNARCSHDFDQGVTRNQIMNDLHGMALPRAQLVRARGAWRWSGCARSSAKELEYDQSEGRDVSGRAGQGFGYKLGMSWICFGIWKWFGDVLVMICKTRERRLLPLVKSPCAWKCTCGSPMCLSHCRFFPGRCRGCNLGVSHKDIEFLAKRPSNKRWLKWERFSWKGVNATMCDGRTRTHETYRNTIAHARTNILHVR